jgi:glucokinase
MEDYLLNIYQDKVDIIPSKLKASDAAILGASALAWQNS